MPCSRTRRAVLAATLALSSPALCLAAPAPGRLSFPRAKDPVALAQWLSERTDLPLEAVVVSGPDAVFAVLPSPGLSQAPGGRRVRVLQEVIEPSFVPTLGGRSAVLELDVDCAGRRVMRQAFDIYGGSNQGGEVERLGAGKLWSGVEPETPMAAILTAACAPETVPRPLLAASLARAEPPPAVASATPSPPPPLASQPLASQPVQAKPPAPPPARLATAAAPMVNLGEFASLDAARAAWASATAGQAGRVQRIELTSGRFRALVDGYGSAAEAEAACAAIAARGGSCSLR